jgi:redox-sensitive bicupin YhaK (pirin superfamily)
MSGPVTDADTFVADRAQPPVGGDESSRAVPATDAIEVVASRVTDVAGRTVRRSLPRRDRRTIGAWCFADHFGPETITPATAMEVGPHPHIGLQTVTWLLEGELVHTDSLGTEQPIRPGQLNLMTAGHGVAHAEDGRQHAHGLSHGVQLWVALPERTRNGPAAFEHHAQLPVVEAGPARVTVLVGTLQGATSPARHDTPQVGAELALHGRVEVQVDPAFEHGVLGLSGRVRVGDQPLGEDELAYVSPGHTSIVLASEGAARVLLLGGAPFGERISMWWNFVARTQDEMTEALHAWNDGSDRFGTVPTTLARMPVPRPPWLSTP